MELGVAIDSLNQDPYLFIFEVRNTSLAENRVRTAISANEALFFLGLSSLLQHHAWDPSRGDVKHFLSIVASDCTTIYSDARL